MGRRLALLALVAAAALGWPACSLAATGQLQNGVMIYTAGAGESNNVVFTTAQFGSPTFEVRDAAGVSITPTPPCFNGGTNNVMECPQDGGGTGQVVQLQASLGDGNDTMTVQANLPTSIDAGGGNDTISGGPAADTENGQDGADTISGGAGDDTLNGGAGNDLLLAEAGADGTDSLSGGDGVDTASYAARADPLQLSLDDQPNDGLVGNATDNVHTDVENLIGGSGGDSLSGDPAANQLDGGPGNDSLAGQAGDDALTGGTGDDSESGGDGADAMSGDAGNDSLDGGAGPDVFSGGDGTDTGDYSTRTAPLNVTLDGNANDGEFLEGDNVETDVENLRGGSGADTLVGSDAGNTLDGGPGEDYSDGGAGSDTLVGGDAGDVLRTRGSPDGDTVTCGPGPDFVIAKPNDTVSPDCDRVDRGVNQKPKLRDSAVVAPVSGTLQMSPAGIVRRVPLQDKVVLPLRSVVDTAAGAVKVTSAASAHATQSVSLDEGAFDITQNAAKLPVTQFALQGGDFSACGPAATRKASAAAAKVVRTLWATGKGSFRTKGRFATATIRGTRWQTVDRCDGTLIRVARGAVTVRDLVKKRTLVVRAGSSYLARR